MAQVVAYALGLTPDRVAVRLGDTRLPEQRRLPTQLPPSCSRHRPHARRRSSWRLSRDAPFPRAAPNDVIVTDSRISLARTNLNITYAELLAP
jgi:hypothetical protein